MRFTRRNRYFVVLLFFIFLTVSAAIDFDWMVTQWYYGYASDGQPLKTVDGVWWFTPWFGMDWWSAYAFTIVRLAVGCIGLGWYLRKIRTIDYGW